LFTQKIIRIKKVKKSKMSELSHESVLVQIKDALTRDGIKLWLSPYYLEMESNESEMLVNKKENYENA
jgi:hypothetical protein